LEICILDLVQNKIMKDYKKNNEKKSKIIELTDNRLISKNL